MNKEKVCEVDSKRSTNSRGAVESAIDISKGDQKVTWEESVQNSLNRVSRWESYENETAATQRK